MEQGLKEQQPLQKYTTLLGTQLNHAHKLIGGLGGEKARQHVGVKRLTEHLPLLRCETDIANQVVGAVSGENLGQWVFASSGTVSDVKAKRFAKRQEGEEEEALSVCDNSVLHVQLLKDQDVLKAQDSISMAAEAGMPAKLVLTCIKHDVEKAMSNGLTVLHAVMDKSLDWPGLSEVRAYAKPPALVGQIMCAVMLVMGKDPTWAQVIMEMDDFGSFIEKIKATTPDSISVASLSGLTIGCNSAPGDFASMGCPSIFWHWVRFMKLYAEVACGDRPVDRQAVRAELDCLRNFVLALELGDTLHDTLDMLCSDDEGQSASAKITEADVKLHRKYIIADMDQFTASPDFKVLEEVVAIQERLPFVASCDLSHHVCRNTLSRWNTLTTSLAAMLFEQTFPMNSNLRFSLEPIEKAREMAKSANLEQRVVAEEFLKAVDSHMTTIAMQIKNALPHSGGLGGFLNTELAEAMANYITVWEIFRSYSVWEIFRSFCNDNCHD